MASRFVRPETRVLKISNGDSITVKRRLNTGEQRHLMQLVKERDKDGRLRADLVEVGIAMVCAYLVDWSLVDDNGNHVSLAEKSTDEIRAAVDLLDNESFDEIREAIDKHVAESTAARSEEKNAQSGESGSPQISVSHESLVGATSGSPS